ncbi:LGFP repeat-containing protein [Nocardia macrotermitis]|uniref:LGFP repeat-containing protein n=1 Tax=Nocardia macrotermitis TaxID=2585198 RepID=A0A7K0D219_9NOCA|nr:hypothetical protein [Nocardia macrotermitis]MQY19770.1 hypothetical protein [Nocardia macrotermitis]
MQPGRSRSRRPFGRGVLALTAGVATVVFATVTGAGPASARHIGAFDVGGAIEKAYDKAGGASFFGNPTGPESAAQGGRFQVFERGCSIYWSVGTDAHDVCGLIRDKYAELGWERSPLGFPLSNESKAGNDGAGRYNMFPGGVIYWSEDTGAHAVWGSIAGVWQGNGAEKGRYGYPTSDEYDYNDGKAQDFQGGRITWHP